MANERKQIRQQLKTALDAVFSYPVYAEREPDSRGLNEFITLHIDSGEIEYDGITGMVTAILSVGYHKSGLVNDDELDDQMGLIDRHINRDSVPEVSGFSLTSFYYKPNDDEDFSSLINQYEILYQRK